MSNVETLSVPSYAGQLVDNLGDLRARIKALQDEAKVIEADLKAYAKSTKQRDVDGTWYHATVSCSDRARVDWKAVAEKLEPSRQLVTAHTSHVEVCTLRLSAHKK